MGNVYPATDGVGKPVVTDDDCRSIETLGVKKLRHENAKLLTENEELKKENEKLRERITTLRQRLITTNERLSLVKYTIASTLGLAGDI